MSTNELSGIGNRDCGSTGLTRCWKSELVVHRAGLTEAQAALAQTQQARLAQLVAPVDGTVQQVAVHTDGGVVTPAQVLMVIVPNDAQVTAEVVVDNKDIGFVGAGQAAAIKLETFPFTRYGTVAATVKSVVADAVNDEKRGAIFPAVLSLDRASIDVDGKRINLSPGMNLTAEIKTGKRRVIEYLLSPVQRHVDESLKERCDGEQRPGITADPQVAGQTAQTAVPQPVRPCRAYPRPRGIGRLQLAPKSRTRPRGGSPVCDRRRSTHLRGRQVAEGGLRAGRDGVSAVWPPTFEKRQIRSRIRRSCNQHSPRVRRPFVAPQHNFDHSEVGQQAFG